MTVSEAITKMQTVVTEGRDRLSGYGFEMSVETDYMNAFYKTVDDVGKAKFVTVSLVVGKKGCTEGEEYCMSLGAEIVRKTVNESQLDKDIQNYEKMVNEAIKVLEKYENKDEGLDVLTAKASEEYKKFLAKLEEEQRKSRRISMISNIIFIVGIALLFIVAFLK